MKDKKCDLEMCGEEVHTRTVETVDKKGRLMKTIGSGHVANIDGIWFEACCADHLRELVLPYLENMVDPAPEDITPMPKKPKKLKSEKGKSTAE